MIHDAGPTAQDHHHSMRSFLMDQLSVKEESENQPFSIRAAGSAHLRASANILISKRYGWRGYQSTTIPDIEISDSVTLVASERETTIGTITIGFDGANGILADELFLDKTDQIRSSGRQVCEFTKLAMDSVNRSKRVLASLFHVAYIVAQRVRGVDDLLIEVNPRHVGYYQKMLGFQVLSSERNNRRVNAPAVLLCLDLAWAHDQISRFNHSESGMETERSLYPYCFSAEEESRIFHRLKHYAAR